MGGWSGPGACPDRTEVRPIRAAQRVLAYLHGLLVPTERKNSWTLAERAGEASPDGMQRLLAGADRDPHAVRDDVRGYVVEYFDRPRRGTDRG